MSGLRGGAKGAYSMAEVRQHNSRHDAWTVIHGKVYNITQYLHYHPGGFDELMRGAGADCSALFDEIHPWVNAEGMLKTCLVGVLDKSVSAWLPAVPAVPAPTPRPPTRTSPRAEACRSGGGRATRRRRRVRLVPHSLARAAW
jgi:cytochrome b involved in lipid metabolism